jgi:hypothetical protein
MKVSDLFKRNLQVLPNDWYDHGFEDPGYWQRRKQIEEIALNYKE